MDIHNSSKALRKQLRLVIKKGLETDYQVGLKIAQRVTEAWESGALPAKDAHISVLRKMS